jgi:hypothetical protein
MQENRVYCIGKKNNIIPPEDEGVAIFRIVQNYDPNYTASHPRILDTFLTKGFFKMPIEPSTKLHVTIILLS